VAKQASQAFDEYWNCKAAYPVTALGKHADHHHLAVRCKALAHDTRVFAQSDYAQATLDEDVNGATAGRPGRWFRRPATLVADQPEKIEATTDQPELRIDPDIRAMTDSAQHSVLLISPCFIPGNSGTRYISSLAARGITVKVLTHSLVSSDEPAVYSGYSRYRQPLLESGVQLYELRLAAAASQPATSGGTCSGASLHARAIVVDSRKVFIGSMNMDARSRLLNTETGIIVESASLAEAVTRFFDAATLPTSACQVVLILAGTPDTCDLQWRASRDGKPVIHDPDATMQRRAAVQLLKPLPIEGLL
jgi:putative cardiolipin synthase